MDAPYQCYLHKIEFGATLLSLAIIMYIVVAYHPPLSKVMLCKNCHNVHKREELEIGDAGDYHEKGPPVAFCPDCGSDKLRPYKQ